MYDFGPTSVQQAAETAMQNLHCEGIGRVVCKVPAIFFTLCDFALTDDTEHTRISGPLFV